MNLHCKCGNKIIEKDFILDPTGTWCHVCWAISQEIINEFDTKGYEIDNVDNNPLITDDNSKLLKDDFDQEF